MFAEGSFFSALASKHSENDAGNQGYSSAGCTGNVSLVELLGNCLSLLLFGVAWRIVTCACGSRRTTGDPNELLFMPYIGRGSFSHNLAKKQQGVHTLLYLPTFVGINHHGKHSFEMSLLTYHHCLLSRNTSSQYMGLLHCRV